MKYGAGSAFSFRAVKFRASSLASVSRTTVGVAPATVAWEIEKLRMMPKNGWSLKIASRYHAVRPRFSLHHGLQELTLFAQARESETVTAATAGLFKDVFQVD